MVDDDIAGTRRTMERCATKFNICFLLILALLGSLFLIIGLVGASQDDFRALESVPGSVLLLAIGVVAFSLFFPWCMLVYFCRHLLVCIKRLEKEAAEKKEEPTE